MKANISRRAFLKGSLAATGLTIAVSITPFGYKLLNASEGKKNASLSFKPDAWLEITPDNVVTITVGQSDLGQGTRTALAMILADELEADWRQIQVRQGGANNQFKNSIAHAQITAASISIRNFYAPLRELGAACRAMLVTAAALTWGVPTRKCEAIKGTVRENSGGRSLTYGQLCLKAAKLPMPKKPHLKKTKQFRYIGTNIPRLDVPDKVGGTAIFGIDVDLPDLHFAVLARPPVYGAKIISYNQKAAEAIKGVRKIVPVPQRGIAVCASTLDAAWKGRDALDVNWSKGTHPTLNNDYLYELSMDLLSKKGMVAIEKGDAKQALTQAGKKVTATYFVPYVAHAALEPMNCTAYVRNDRCDVWAPTQFQTGALGQASKESGLPPEKVHIHTTYVGGAFGRRIMVDYLVEAVRVSKALGKPVKVLWTREESMKNDFYRPATCQRVEAGLNEKGELTGWSHKVVYPSIMKCLDPKTTQYPFALWGWLDKTGNNNNTDYQIPNLYLELVLLDLPIPVGFWRSVQNAPNAFVIESFMDEVAHAAGKDPVEFRLGFLKNNDRARRVLETVAEKSGWGQSLPKGQGRGIAQHFCFESYICNAVEVSVNEDDGSIKVNKIVSAVDCGLAVDPANLKAQIEGGIIMALSTALKEEVVFGKGGVGSSNYDDYQIIKMSEVPEIEVHIVESGEKVGGIGEVGVPPTAPAVANAVFDATGIRFRRLPMNPARVLEAIKKKSG